MEVILLQAVAKLGRAYEIKQVAEGYGRNFLLARGLALLATPANKAKLAAQQAATQAGLVAKQAVLNELLRRLSEKPLIIKAKANPAGHLFAGLHTSDIVAALEKAYQLKLPPQMIKLKQSLKTLGEHQLELEGGKRLTIKIEAA